MGGRRSSSRMSAAKGLATLALSAILYVTGCSAFLVTAPSAVRGWRSAPGKVDGGICGKLELPGAVAVKHVQGSTLTRVRTDKGRLRSSGGGIVSTRASAVEAWSFTGAEPPGVFRAGNGMAGDEVLTIRHDKIGTCLELWHGSYGWFDYAPSDGASLVLCDNWAVTQPRINKGFANMRQQNDLRAAVLRGDDRFKLKDAIKAGTWNVRAAGGGKAIFVNNEYSPRQQLILTEEGFVFIGSKGLALVVEYGGGEQQLKTEEALALPALQGL